MNIKTYAIGFSFIISVFGMCSVALVSTLLLEERDIIVGAGIVYLLILGTSLACMKSFRGNDFLFYTFLSVIIGYPLTFLIVPAALFILFGIFSLSFSISESVLFYLPLLYLISSPVLLDFYKNRQFVAYTIFLSFFPALQFFFAYHFILPLVGQSV